jgi:N-acetylmuramoyl-L-alanine amidase
MEGLSRTQRRQAGRRRTRGRIAAWVAAATLTCLLVAGAAFAVMNAGDSRDAIDEASEETTQQPAITLDETSTLEAVVSELESEVPDVMGLTLESAEMLLTYAGFTIVGQEAALVPEGTIPGTVLSQDPVGGTLGNEGDEVVLVHAPCADDEQDWASVTETHLVVVLDPGHQGRSNLDLEPNGPGSSLMKEKVRGGATGVSTRIPEYETVLQIALMVRDRLSEAGVEVVLTRTVNEVDISNKERAEVANQAGADLFVRIHCDGSGDPEVHGASTLYPAGNQWVAPIASRSLEAAGIVQAAVVRETGAADRGVIARSDITGFNWAKVPAILVECGFLSNPGEDLLLSGDEYRGRVADGIAAGVLEYLDAR